MRCRRLGVRAAFVGLVLSVCLAASLAVAGPLEDGAEAPSVEIMRRRCGFGVRSPTRAIQTLNTGLGSPTMWAQFNLGLLYANGRGVEQDNNQAHLWLNLAAAGSEPAARRTRGCCYQNDPIAACRS